MSEPLEPLSEDLTVLFEREAASYAEDAAIHARVRRGVEMALAIGRGDGGDEGPDGSGGPAAPPAGPRAGLFGAKAIALAALAGSVVGGAVVGVAMRSPPAEPLAAPSAESPAHVPEAAARASTVETPTMNVSDLPSAAPSTSQRPPRVADAAGPSGLRRERELVDAARASLASGHANEALASLSAHEKSFPSGQLAEERDALRVQALVAAGRRSDAEREGARFRAKYPASPLLPIVEGALERHD